MSKRRSYVPGQASGDNLVRDKYTRAYILELWPTDVNVFRYHLRELKAAVDAGTNIEAMIHLADRLLEYAQLSVDRIGEDRTMDGIMRILKLIMTPNPNLGGAAQINLTSQLRYDLMYNLLDYYEEQFPKYAPKLVAIRRRMAKIQDRFYDNYRRRRPHHSRRRPTDGG